MILAAIVFDFDGLIVDTENPGFISWEEIYQEFGATLKIDDWRHATVMLAVLIRGFIWSRSSIAASIGRS